MSNFASNVNGEVKCEIDEWILQVFYLSEMKTDYFLCRIGNDAPVKSMITFFFVVVVVVSAT